MLCPKCTKVIPEDSEFCNKCGYKLDLSNGNTIKEYTKGERKHATILSRPLSLLILKPEYKEQGSSMVSGLIL
jgi:predicted amidophosphoribosyltransferase